MLTYPKLQAHRGVSTECPENTMAAFKTAIAQNYAYIELDPNFTLDRKIVVLHDDTLNRTARNFDGSPLENTLRIADMTYNEALHFDFGIGFSLKFKGEHIPLLEDVLELAKENSVKVKLDNKIEKFPKDVSDVLYAIIEKYESGIALTTGKEETLHFYANRFPGAELHYDGPVSEEILENISPLSDRLTVWMPHFSPLTSWAKVPFADAALCDAVKKIAKLGIWIIKDYASFDSIFEQYVPDIVETTGTIKPIRTVGGYCDMHVHSHNSHDSRAPIAATAEEAIKNGVKIFAITDHSDTQYYFSGEIPQRIAASVKEVRETAPQYEGKVEILTGCEIGEMVWDEFHADELLHAHDYDVIIGSVHAVRYKEWSDPYSMIDLRTVPTEEMPGFMDKYFDEVLETLEKLPCDIMAHLTCPLRYINGKYNLNFDIRPYEKKIERILQFIIDHGIAMEVNTSGKIGENGYYMPDEWIIEKYHDMGGYLITLGSDAHVSENIGRAFEETLRMLKQFGFRNYFYCKKRRLLPCTL